MPPTPAEINSPVLLEQARRYVDAEDERVGGLQTRAASLLAAVLVLVGLTFTVESQFSNRDLPRWISLVIAIGATVALLVSAWYFVRVLTPRRIDPIAPQAIRLLLLPGLVDSDPVVLARQLIDTLGTELDDSRSTASWIEEGVLVARRWLIAGVTGALILAALFGGTHDKPTVQRVKVVSPVDVRVTGRVNAEIVAPIEARIVGRISATLVGQLNARIVAPITVLTPPEDPPRNLGRDGP